MAKAIPNVTKRKVAGEETMTPPEILIKTATSTSRGSWKTWKLKSLKMRKKKVTFACKISPRNIGARHWVNGLRITVF